MLAYTNIIIVCILNMCNTENLQTGFFSKALQLQMLRHSKLDFDIEKFLD